MITASWQKGGIVPDTAFTEHLIDVFAENEYAIVDDFLTIDVAEEIRIYAISYYSAVYLFCN